MVFDAENKIWSGPTVPPAYDPESSLGSLILKSLKQTPDRIMLTVDGFDISCEVIYKKSIKIIKFLQSLGLKQQDVVGMIGVSSENIFAVVIACLTLGLPINPLATVFNVNDIVYMFSMTKPKIIICDGNLIQNVESAREKLKNDCKVLTLVDKIEGYEFIGDIVDCNNADDGDFEFPHLVDISSTPAFILCSSGTTSMVKGVVRTHKQLIYSLNKFPSLENSPNILITPTYSFYWISSVFMLSEMCFFGAQFITSTKPFNADVFIDTIEEKKVTFILIFPLILIAMKESRKFRKLESVKFVMVGGCVLDEKYIKEVEEVFPNAKIFAAYGSTEMSLCTRTIVDKFYGCSGKTAQNFKIKIVDENGKNLGPNEVGEICVQSPAMFSYYYDSPEKTAEAIKDGWFHTGDVGYFNNEEYIFVLERKKDMLVTNGIHYTPLEIESIINEINDVVTSTVVGIEVNGDDVTYAFVIKKQNSDLKEEEVQNFVNSRVIEDKKIEGGVIFVEKFPTTASGKVRRTELREVVRELRKKLKQ